MRTQNAPRRTVTVSVFLAIAVALCAVVGISRITFAYADEAQTEQTVAVDSELFPMGNDRIWAGEVLHLSDVSVPNDLLAAGRMIDLRDCTMGGSARVAAQNIDLTNVTARQNITIAGETLKISGSKATVIAMAGRIASFSGTCDELSIYAADVFIDGTVTGDVTVGASSITLGKNANIAGTLHVESAEKPTLQEGAQVAAIEYVADEEEDVAPEEEVTPEDNEPAEPQPHNTQKEDNAPQNQGEDVFSGIFSTIRLFFTIIGIVGTVLIALLAEWLFAHDTAEAAKMVRERTTTTILTGVIGMVAAPMTIILLCVLIVTLPIAGLLALVLFALSIASGGFAGASLSKLALPKLGRYVGAAAGGAIIGVASAIPFVGALVSLAAYVYLLGYVLQTIYRGLQKDKPPVPDAPSRGDDPALPESDRA